MYQSNLYDDVHADNNDGPFKGSNVGVVFYCAFGNSLHELIAVVLCIIKVKST